MISVSNSFKKAIKSENRGIYGYVEMNFQNNSYNTHVSEMPDVLDIMASDGSGLVKGIKTLQKYATLEHNYTLLDGSFMVWNENVLLSNGYISDNTFENILDTTITIVNDSSSIATKGISIYFKENLPFNFEVTFTDTNNNTTIDTVTNNQSMVYQYIFSEEKYISQVSIHVSNVEFPKNRLRIAYVDFNVSDLYEGDELVNFDVTEELDLLIENLPINTCTITLNNYPNSQGGNKFDPINPKGITKYLNNNVTLEPYIGVLTEDNGVEYVKMGVFYLDDWTSNSDGNVTLNGKSVLSKLENMVIPDTGNFFSLTTPRDLSNYLNNNTDYNFSFMNGYYAFKNDELVINNLLEYLKLLLIFNSITISSNGYVFQKFYVNRNNTIVLNTLNSDSVDNISRNHLKSDVDYNSRSKISQLNIKYKSVSTMGTTQTETIINDTHTMFTREEYVWYNISNRRIWDNNPIFNYSVVSGSGSASLIDKNDYFMVVKFTGTVGSQISVTYTNRTQNEEKMIKTSSILVEEHGDNMDIDISNFGYAYPEYLNLIQNYYINMDKPYNIKADTMGDPSLEIGDTVSIQTRYTDTNDGYKDMIITKQHFTFDGGLQCSLEGVGD